MRRDVRLYNVLFPVWMFYIFPTAVWLLILPGNFIIDSLVLLLAMRHYRHENQRTVWKRSILRVWGLGFLCDFCGAVLTMALLLLLDGLNLPTPMTIPFEQLLVLPGIALAGFLIYRTNRAFAFQKTTLDDTAVRRLSLALAIFTAPYTMLFPSEWLY